MLHRDFIYVFINILKKEAAVCQKYTSSYGVIHLKSTVQISIIVQLVKYDAVLYCM